MARKFFIAKTIPATDEKSVYFLLEEKEGVLVEPIAKLASGEPDPFKICKGLVKVAKSESKNSKSEYAERAFTVSNLQSITMTVDTDSSLTLLYPLELSEIDFFFRSYLKAGNYS